MNITQEQLDELAELAEKAGNLVAASRLRVSPAIHLEGMRSGLESIEAALRRLYVEISGENPWSHNEDDEGDKE